MDIVGYVDPWSLRAGDVLKVFVSRQLPGFVDAEIIRILGGPTQVDGFGLRWQPTGIGGRYEAGPQHTDSGSYAIIPSAALMDSGGFDISVTVWPTTPEHRRQAIVHACDAVGRGFCLDLIEGRARVTIGNARGRTAVIEATTPLRDRTWYSLGASWRPRDGRLALRVEAVSPSSGISVEDIATIAKDAYAPISEDWLLAGARAKDGYVDDHFNGKLESPIVRDPETGRIVTHWDLSQGIDGVSLFDRVRPDVRGALVNMPARGVTGSTWSGRNFAWPTASSEYGAIHFHEDDLDDARWTPTMALRLPHDLQSGIYGVRLRSGDVEEVLPFFVRPAANGPRAPVLFLAPTATYLAYANDHQAFDNPNPERSIGRPIVLQPRDVYLHLHRELGLSLYDRHADGSGVMYASRLRPTPNMWPRYRRWDGADGFGQRWLNLDLSLIGWLSRRNEPFDVATDEDLDDQGDALLAPYRVVLSGSQPEYVSTRMLDALEAYTAAGGRLMYLGGNGFYYRVAYHPKARSVMELRRGFDGAGPWDCAPGENHLAATGEEGGTWRTLGRPPQRLVGVGFVAEGFTRSGPYLRTEDSYSSAVSFVFDGVQASLFGDAGLSGGGAAGIEVDQARADLGTPANAVVLARAALPSRFYQLCALEARNPPRNSDGEKAPAAGADMVLLDRVGGGAVFATGSIAWIGALEVNDGDNDVSRITGNVLRRFLDLEPLDMASGLHAGRTVIPTDRNVSATAVPGANSSASG